MQNAALERYAADKIWHMLVNLVRQVVWLKHGVEPRDITSDKVQLKRIAAICSWRRLNKALDSLYAAEQLFSKTTAQHAVLEMILLKICSDDEQGGNNSGASGSPSAPAMAQEIESQEAEDLEEDDDVVDEEEDDEVPEDDHASWNGFLMQLNKLDEPLLISVFKQGKVCAHDKVMARLDVEFSTSHLFFSDLMSEARSAWEPLLHTAYGVKVAMNALFTGPVIVGARRQATRKPDASTTPVATIPAKVVSTPTSPADSMSGGVALVNVVPVTTLPTKVLRPMPTITAQPKAVSAKAVSGNKGVYPVLKQGRPDYRNQQRGGVERQPFAFAREPLLDVSDEKVWKKAAMVRRYFPGECREVRESV
jgi:DNA polymerase III gamma/tau subunit